LNEVTDGVSSEYVEVRRSKFMVQRN